MPAFMSYQRARITTNQYIFAYMTLHIKPVKGAKVRLFKSSVIFVSALTWNKFYKDKLSGKQFEGRRKWT